MSGRGRDGSSVPSGHNDERGRDCVGAILTPEDIELYWRVKNNPYRRNRLSFEKAIIFCDTVQHELAKLDGRSQFILQAKAAGYGEQTMAQMCGVSLRTMSRWMQEFEYGRGNVGAA
jgi:hypothetical protein